VGRVTGVPVSDIAMFASTVIAAAGFFGAARSSELRRSFVLLGWSATAWAAGVGSWLAIASLSHSGSGMNPVSGSLMLAGSGLALAGTLALPGAPSALGSKLRLALDCLLVATSVMFIAWEPLVEPVIAASHRSVLSELATLALPVADMVMLAAIIAVFWRSTGGRVMFGLLAASAALHTATDMRFADYALSGHAGHGDATIDVGWALAYGLLALAAVASATQGLQGSLRTRRPHDRRLQFLLYLPVGAALVTAAVVGLVERRMHGAQLTVMLLIAALLVARQWITLSENRQLLQRVAFQAEHDDLTGLLNRAGLLRCVSEVVAAGGAVRVHLIDIEGFKDVNDTLGHPVGDSLLIAIGNRLRRAGRGLRVARVGSDEFAVVDGRHDAIGLAERLLAAIGQPYAAAGRAVNLDASLGIAGHEAATGGGEPADPDAVAVELLRDADSAMYAAKTAGGGIRLFEDGLRREMRDRVALGRELRDALARGELTLAYQPVVHLPTGEVRHVEALARWNHPERGAVPPATFIPLAEGSGLMPLLGRWVLRTACAQAAAWNKEGFDVGVCVNVSAQQLDDSCIEADVAETLRRTGLAPERLVLELTESLFVADSDAGLRPLEKLRATGVRIAIDDFGTGYSALGYLRRLPVDTLKLDRRFVSELDDADVAVLTAILAMARALGLETIVEGIETPDQLALLKRLGCQLGQGYHLARPMDAAAIPGHLRGGLPRAA
jgi:diguanylate cyclase (GGDEF)-like protein